MRAAPVTRHTRPQSTGAATNKSCEACCAILSNSGCRERSSGMCSQTHISVGLPPVFCVHIRKQSDKDDPFSSEMAASCGGRLTLSGLTLLLNGSLTVFVKLCPRKSYFVLINHSLGRDREGRFSQMN